MFLLEIHPIISILLSILLINGFYNFSYILDRKTNYLFLKNYKINNSFIFFFIIINFTSVVLYCSFLIFGVNKNFLQLVCFFFIFIGFYKPYYLISIIKNIVATNSKIKFLIFFILFLYFLLSLMPISDPDSLEYHLTVPYLSLESGVFNIEPEWFRSQTAGAGEALTTLSLSINAFQFSAILQYISLFLLILIIFQFDSAKFKFNLKTKNLIILCILCIPSFLFLVFTLKPTLFSITSNFIAFILTVFVLPNEIDKKKSLYIYSLIIFLILCSTQFKFSFFLSAGIIGILSTYEMVNKKLLTHSIIIGFLLTCAIILPREYYDYVNLNSNIIQNFFNPVVDKYNVFEHFMNSERHGPGNSRYALVWLFLPVRFGQISLNWITETLGISVFIFIFHIKFFKIEVKKSFIAFFTYILLGLIFGQPAGRFFIEPFLWAMFCSLLYINYYKNNLLLIFEKIVIVNSLLIVLALIFTIITFFPGIISTKNYKETLKLKADGYLAYDWANKILPKDAVLISTHRAYAFSINKFISSQFRSHIINNEQRDHYIGLIAKKKPTHILYLEHTYNNNHDYFYSCRGKLVAHGKDVGRIVGRNPFNINKNNYDTYIYEINLDKNKNCRKK